MKIRKKGLFFSLDAAFALIIAIGFILSIYMIINVKKPNYDNALAHDTLLSLEKDGLLKDAVKTKNLSRINTTLQWYLPKTFCARISLFNSSDLNVTPPLIMECWNNQISASVAYRTFTINGSSYYAVMEAIKDE